jgi:hypothetical protein
VLPWIEWAVKAWVRQLQSLLVRHYACDLGHICSPLKPTAAFGVSHDFSRPLFIHGWGNLHGVNRRTASDWLGVRRAGPHGAVIVMLATWVFCLPLKPMVVFGVPHDFSRPSCSFTAGEIYMG